jgi:hypothetical protein
MHGLSAMELLELWERGLTQPPVERALSLLTAACAETIAGQIAGLSIGQRDARLLALREALFGPEVEAFVMCPRCGERLELNFSAKELRSSCEPEPDREVALRIDGYDVRLRPPNSQDLMTIASQAELAASRDHVLRRCLLSVNDGNTQVAFDSVPREVVEGAARKITEIDPLADIRMSICCHSCRHVWQATFDILSFLWSEIEVWARRVMAEVHTLASAYGWCERDILALSPNRRQFYLDMVRA